MAIGAKQGGLDVAEQGVDPPQLRMLRRLTPTTRDERLMHAARFDHGVEAGQPVAEHPGLGRQMCLSEQQYLGPK